MRSSPNIGFKVSQVLNAALSASVIICLAQGLPSVLIAEDFAASFLPSMVFAAVIVAYNLKQYVDEFRAFEHAENEEFSIARTVFFGTVSYLSLAAAGYSIGKPETSAIFLIAYFSTLVAWSVASAVARFGYRESEQNTDKLRRRLLWIVIYLLAATAIWALIYFDKTLDPVWLCAVVFSLVILFICDVRDSNTFDEHHTGGV